MHNHRSRLYLFLLWTYRKKSTDNFVSQLVRSAIHLSSVSLLANLSVRWSIHIIFTGRAVTGSSSVDQGTSRSVRGMDGISPIGYSSTSLFINQSTYPSTHESVSPLVSQSWCRLVNLSAHHVSRNSAPDSTAIATLGKLFQHIITMTLLLNSILL